MNLLLVEPADFGQDGVATLAGRRAEHLRKVLRLAPGETVRLAEIDGRRGTGTVLSIGPGTARLEVEWHEPRALPPAPVVLAVALPRPPSLRKVIVHATCLGVERICLFGSKRVEKSFWESSAMGPEGLDEHLRLGMEQAADPRRIPIEQHRRFVPFVEERLPELVAQRSAMLLAAHPGRGPVCPVATPGEATVLVVGPEGGLLDHELERLESAGATFVSLGDRILRVEAAVVALLARRALC